MQYIHFLLYIKCVKIITKYELYKTINKIPKMIYRFMPSKSYKNNGKIPNPVGGERMGLYILSAYGEMSALENLWE